MDNLLPCPFCGGEAKIEQFARNGFHLKCKKCLIGYKQRVLRNSLEWLKSYMIKEWNTRIQPTKIDSKEGAEEEEDAIYDSIYMKVVEIVEKDNIQCEEYKVTANKLKEMFDIKYASPKQ